MMNRDKFSAKVMLFGEYSILLGSSALSIPLTTFNASFRKFPEMDHDITNQYSGSNKVLHSLCDHYLAESGIFSEFLDLDHFMGDIKTGLFLDSTIPQRYGVGSSGALCAAIYNRYAFDPVNPDEAVSSQNMLRLRNLFSHMESFFHGKSSGFDPLVIYLQHPLMISQDNRPEIITFQTDFLHVNGGIFLLDTGSSAGTAPLVRVFFDQYAPEGEMNNAGKELCRLTNSCILDLIENNAGNFWENLEALSVFQLNGLSGMIPEPMVKVWTEILKEGSVYLKLCGSGGGGYLTGFTPDLKRSVNYLKRNNFRIIPVNINNKNSKYHDKNMDQSVKSDPPYI